VVTLAHGTLDATSNGTHEANSTRKVES